MLLFYMDLISYNRTSVKAMILTFRYPLLLNKKQTCLKQFNVLDCTT